MWLYKTAWGSAKISDIVICRCSLLPDSFQQACLKTSTGSTGACHHQRRRNLPSHAFWSDLLRLSCTVWCLQEIGTDNMFIFGYSAEEVPQLRQQRQGYQVCMFSPVKSACLCVPAQPCSSSKPMTGLRCYTQAATGPPGALTPEISADACVEEHNLLWDAVGLHSG